MKINMLHTSMIFALLALTTEAFASVESVCFFGEPTNKNDPSNKNFYASLQVQDLYEGKGTVRGEVFYDLDKTHRHLDVIGITQKVTQIKSYDGLVFSTNAAGDIQNTFILGETDPSQIIAAQTLTFRIASEMIAGVADVSVVYESHNASSIKKVSYSVSAVACRKPAKSDLINNRLFNSQIHELGRSNDQHANTCGTCHT